ncbi:MAG: 3-phosphoglycerate dehydrogenase, partial [SAR324 cluster bacterium]|nr:3-phosphoglycerate dehydrogenase [SAR324 cluster bacterium]
QEAMAQALKNGQVGGFAADVLDPHPVTPDNPLLGLQNVLLTPHIGARTVESVERQGIAALNNMIGVLKGESVSNVVCAK